MISTVKSAGKPGSVMGLADAHARLRYLIRLALDVLLIYPSVALALVLALGGGFTFEGMARSYVGEIATYAGGPATATELSTAVCVNPATAAGTKNRSTDIIAPTKTATSCLQWKYQMVRKDVIVDRLATGARVSYWFLVLTALGIRVAMRLGASLMGTSGQASNLSSSSPKQNR